MKKIINAPAAFVDETLQGIMIAHPGYVQFAGEDTRALVKCQLTPGKVAVVTGGGSGHLPLFLGYIGEGLLDACSVGNVFASPSAMTMYQTAIAAHQGAGVLYLYGNYGGDRMNFDMAAEMLEDEEIEVAQLWGADDVASAPNAEKERRRGVAGIFFAYKVAGAAAQEMRSLPQVVAVTRKALDNIRSMGVALSSCTVPEAGKPTFSIGENEMEIGMGIHGEPGIHRGEMKSADEIVEAILPPILADLPYCQGDQVAILVNSLGATPKEELYVVLRKAAEMLKDAGITLYRAYVGEYATSMEMAGMSISLMKLDEELKSLLDAPASSPLLGLL